MNEVEKAKQLWHLMYLMSKLKMDRHAQDEVRMRDVMTLGRIAAAIQESEMGLVKMCDVSAYFQISPAAVSQFVREYERKGWLKRVVLDSDRRSVYLRVSESGLCMLKEHEEKAMKHIVDFLHYLGEEDSAALLRILDKAKDFEPMRTV